MSSRIETRQDIKKTILLLAQSKKAEKEQKTISPDLGWSPYEAKEFLNNKGLETEYYRPLYQHEWQAASKTTNLDDTAFSGSVIYYVRGSQEIATKLLLRANIYFPDKSDESHALFLDYTKVLFEAAFKKKMPKSMQDAIFKGKNLALDFEKKKVTLAKDTWPNRKFHGYDLEFTIQSK